MYSFVLFLHVVGAMALFGALAVEWLTIVRLRQISSLEGAREWIGVFGRLRFVYGPATAIILLAGLYMTATTWGWTTPWIDVALASWIVLGAVGGVLTGVRMVGLERQLAVEDAAQSSGVQSGVRDSRLWVSLVTRTAMLVGIVFLMTVKPALDGALVAMSAAVVLGLLASAVTAGTRPASESARAANR